MLPRHRHDVQSTTRNSSGRIGRGRDPDGKRCWRLRAHSTLDGDAAARELERQLEELGGHLTALLHAEIRGLDERGLRRELLQLKRDVHNLRPLRPGRLADGLAPDLRRGLRHYQEIQDRRQALADDLRSVFDRELVGIRRRFQELVDAEDFKNGLLLSSRTLAGELRRYARRRAQLPRGSSHSSRVEFPVL